jgi:hypothetical protein
MGASDQLIRQSYDKAANPRPHPADFAHRIRTLATDTDRILRKGHTSSHELVELSMRYDELLEGTHGPHFTDIERWLRNARDLIERRKQSAEGSGLEFSSH